MDRVHFTVNGVKCSAGAECAEQTLLDLVRGAGLTGAKAMCREGGCGACVVSVRRAGRVMAVNACLPLVLQCVDWDVTTVEGLGGRAGAVGAAGAAGYHPLQRALAEHAGSQCGYCSPGWIMAMYSLLESRGHDVSELEVERAFGGNLCRCTGYRPILAAFRGFARPPPPPPPPPGAPPPPPPPPPGAAPPDIEDAAVCREKGWSCGACPAPCGWHVVSARDVRAPAPLPLRHGRVWYRAAGLHDVFAALQAEGVDSYMLVGGNTGRGAYPIPSFPRVMIDVSEAEELRQVLLDQSLRAGAGLTLAELQRVLRAVARQHDDFRYLDKIADHLELVATIPVRNIGTVAGNLMVKHRVPEFASDVFLLLEAAGAVLNIADESGSALVSPADFLRLDMAGRVIVDVRLPPRGPDYHFVSFKIMPRAQNAHAQVNTACLYRLAGGVVREARVVYGGLGGGAGRAAGAERALVGRRLLAPRTLAAALAALRAELRVEPIAGDLGTEFKNELAIRLFYKGVLTISPAELLPARLRSGALDLRRARPLSATRELFDTNPLVWPITEPTPKVESLIQCSGEAAYIGDAPARAREVHGAFVTAAVGRGDIDRVDPAPALKLPGVVSFLSVKDIPGRNSFLSLKAPTSFVEEELFCSGRVRYHDQPLGLLLADSDECAQRAARLVQVTYKPSKEPPVLTIREAQRREPERVSLLLPLPARGRGADVRRVIKNSFDIFGQYHMTMETLCCTARPSDDGLQLSPASHWPDNVHLAVAECLNIEQNRIDMQMGRLGGSYGLKLSRGGLPAVACALAAYLLDRPARLTLSLRDNMRIVGKRLPAAADFEVGVNEKGEIQYMEYQFYEDNGYVVSDPIAVLAVPALKNCYDSRRWSMRVYNVVTDTASNTWCRAPGTLEAIAFSEMIMEQISYELDLDPLQVRLANLDAARADVRELAAALQADSDYSRRRREVDDYNRRHRWKKRGLRVALMSWASVLLCDYHVTLSAYHGDSSVVLRHGCSEVGQGINTKVIQVVAFALNLPKEMVKVKPGDLVSTPNNYLTGGSRATDGVCFGAIKCCQLLLDRLEPLRAELPGAAWGALVAAAFRAGISLQTSYRATSGDQRPGRAAGAACAEVELDVLTGEHEVLRVDLIEDVGESLNPTIDIGQVEGAFTMGCGYWTSEGLRYAASGELLTDRSWHYQVPGACDGPRDLRVRLRRRAYSDSGTLGAKASAEPAACLGVVVALALRAAVAASREDSGQPRTKWFNVDGPFSLEANVLATAVRDDELVLE